MSTWTRAHDAHIARECEGLEVLTCAEAMTLAGIGSKRLHESYLELYGDAWIKNSDGEHTPLGSYLTDPAAALRAAEAWRKKDKEIDRTVGITSAIEGMGMPCTAKLSENYLVGKDYLWRTFAGQAADEDAEPYAAALAWAAYRATGGPA